MRPRARWGLVFAACALGACIEDLDPKDVVRAPRILDIVADRPEINPGGESTLRVVLGGTRGAPSFRWYACVSSDATRNPNSIANFGEGGTFEGCFGDASPNMPLGSGDTATFRAPRNLLESLESLASRFGAFLPPGVATALARDVGLTVGIAVEVEVDGVKLQGYKRLIVSLNPTPNTNPPPPRVRVNNTWVSIVSGEDDRCAPDGGEPLRVPRNQNVALSPDGSETWIESYRVLTASGQLIDRTETAFYSWYATAGRMGRGLTRSPVRDNYWAAPDTAGDQTLWVFLRDGHGGTSGCRLTLRVE